MRGGRGMGMSRGIGRSVRPVGPRPVSVPAVGRAPVRTNVVPPAMPRRHKSAVGGMRRILGPSGPAPRQLARVPAGYRIRRPRVMQPWDWVRTMQPYRIGPRGGYIYRPYSGYRPWRRYSLFADFLGPNLMSWMIYDWFRVWYYAYMLDPASYTIYGRNPYYSVPESTLTASLPELGYVDFRTWDPEQIDAHIRELEYVYGATVAMGYRIIPDPATGRLHWIYRPRIPPQGAPLPGTPAYMTPV